MSSALVKRRTRRFSILFFLLQKRLQPCPFTHITHPTPPPSPFCRPTWKTLLWYLTTKYCMCSHCQSQSLTRVQQMDRILKEERKYIVDICQVRDSVFSVITVLHVVLSHAAQTTTSVIA